MELADYREVREVGKGAFGRAVLVETLRGPRAGELAVIKQINLSVLSEQARKEAEQEVQVRQFPTPSPPLPFTATALCYRRGGRSALHDKAM